MLLRSKSMLPSREHAFAKARKHGTRRSRRSPGLGNLPALAGCAAGPRGARFQLQPRAKRTHLVVRLVSRFEGARRSVSVAFANQRPQEPVRERGRIAMAEPAAEAAPEVGHLAVEPSQVLQDLVGSEPGFVNLRVVRTL